MDEYSFKYMDAFWHTHMFSLLIIFLLSLPVVFLEKVAVSALRDQLLSPRRQLQLLLTLTQRQDLCCFCIHVQLFLTVLSSFREKGVYLLLPFFFFLFLVQKHRLFRRQQNYIKKEVNKEILQSNFEWLISLIST